MAATAPLDLLHRSFRREVVGHLFRKALVDSSYQLGHYQVTVALAVKFLDNIWGRFLGLEPVSATVKAASLLAKGQTAAISAKIVAITKGEHPCY